MKTTIPSTKKKSRYLFLSRNLLIISSTLLIIFSCQYSFSQDYDFQQSDDYDKFVVMEAENFSSNTPMNDDMWAETDSPEDFSGQGAMMAVASAPFPSKEDAIAGSPVLTYKINFVESGVHYIWARASRVDGGSDSYHAGIDGVITETSAFLTFHNTDFDNGTWGWINYYNTVGPASVDVPSTGVHELNIYIRENNFRIDKILLTTSDTNEYKPEEMGPDETLPPNGLRDASANFNGNLFTLSTNLVNEELMVFIDEKEYLQGKLEIVDLQGKVLRSVAINNDSQLSLNVANLQSGMYLVRVQLANNSVLVKKFIKN